MVNVRSRVAAIESQQSAMSHDLKQFLDLVWSHRKRHSDNSYLARNASAYRLYTRRHKTKGIGSAEMIRFLGDILPMPQLPEIQCSIRDPNDELGQYLKTEFNATRAASGFTSLSRGEFTNLHQAATYDAELCNELARTFYHFRRVRRTTKERIYLHTKPLEAITVMDFVLRQMILQPNAHPGLNNAKVAAPNRYARFDTIVMYFSDAAAINTALSAIATYQQTGGNRQRFDHGTTRGTEMITKHNGIELVGVGTGAEPPVKLAKPQGSSDLVLVPGSSSFGAYRSKLIDFALKKTLQKGEGKDQFINRVADYFHAAGIDPKQPQTHENPPELKYRARVTLQQLRNGIEPTMKIS